MRTANDLQERAKKLTDLKDGWYDEIGKAPGRDTLAHFTTGLTEHYPATWSSPALVPTPEGNILLEWNGPGEPSVDVDLAAMSAVFQKFDADGGDVEATFVLRDDADWREFIAFLGEHLDEHFRVARYEEQ